MKSLSGLEPGFSSSLEPSSTHYVARRICSKNGCLPSVSPPPRSLGLLRSACTPCVFSESIFSWGHQHVGSRLEDDGRMMGRIGGAEKENLVVDCFVTCVFEE